MAEKSKFTGLTGHTHIGVSRARVRAYRAHKESPVRPVNPSIDDCATLGRWLAACCTPVSDAWTSTRDLHASWSAWAGDNDVYAGSVKKFAQRLKALGLIKRDTRTYRGFSWISLKSASDGVNVSDQQPAECGPRQAPIAQEVSRE